MKTLFLVVGMLALITTLWAQYVTVTDNSCTVWTGNNCAGYAMHGCNSTTFSVGSQSTHTLTASVEGCDQSRCVYCLSEAYIYDDRGQQVGCVHNACTTDCGALSTSVTLYPNITYRLYSCKTDCSGINDCANCSTSCVARATVDVFP